MKKFLSILVTLAMVTAMLVLPTNADVAGSTSQSGELYDTTQAVNGVLNIDGEDYIVINEANKDTFMEMTGENNYILGANLNLLDENGNPKAWGAPDKWYGNLEGNGHSVTGFSVDEGGMFSWGDPKGETEEGVVKITNIKFGSERDLISVTYGKNFYQGLLGRTAYGRTYLFENIEAYVSVGSGDTKNYYMGGFIGELGYRDKPVNATFKNCVLDGEMNGTIFLGGYVGLLGYASGDTNVVNFINCVNSIDITANPDYCIRGGFIGSINGPCGTVNVTNCINEGNITGGCRYVNDKNYCNKFGTSSLVGSSSGATLNVDGFLNLGKIELIIGNHVDDQGTPVAVGEHVASGVVLGCQENKDAVVESTGRVYTSSQALNSVGDPIFVSENDLKSGKVAYLLGAPYGQEIGTDAAPVLGGVAVVERTDGDNVYYENALYSIQSADDLKQINGEGLYRFENDLVLTETVEISGSKNGNPAVLNLNGKTLTGNIVVTDGSVVVRNGKLISETDAAAITAKGNAVLETMDVNISGKLGIELGGVASVTLSKGTVVDASDVAVFGNGADANAVLNVNEAELKVTGDAAGDSALKWNALGTLNISDGKIQADGEGVALEFIKGNVVILGGTLSGKYALVLSGEENSTLRIRTATLQGTAAAILDKANSATVSINGGSFKGTADGAFAADGALSSSVSVVDGIFDEEIPTEYLAREYVSVKNEDGSYSVKYHDHDYTNCNYEYANSGFHKKFCTICNESVNETHSWGEYVDDGEGKHYQVCTGCGSESTHRDHKVKLDAATGNKVCETCGSVIASEESETTTPTNSGTPGTTAPDVVEEGGCKSTVSYAMLVVMILAACGFIVKKKKGYASL